MDDTRSDAAEPMPLITSGVAIGLSKVYLCNAAAILVGGTVDQHIPLLNGKTP